jgi:protein-disulfide isomerase
MMAVMRLCATCAILLALSCSTPAQQASEGQNGSDVAAQIGGRTITVKEVDDKWQQMDAGDHAEAVQRIYEGRKNALDAIVADMLIEQAAKANGVSPEQFRQSEVARRIKPVTDADVSAFYQQNQAQIQGRALVEMTPAIQRYLEQQQRDTAYQALVAELRKAGPAVKLVIDAPRSNVTVGADDPVLGKPAAPVTIVEFSDFQCPFCARVRPTLKSLYDAYGDRVRIVWKDFPLTAIHPQAFVAAQAGNCAREQGKFWEYHDKLFANQQALQPEFLKRYAAETGLDAATFNACLDTAKYSDRVQQQIGAGTTLGVSATPSVFINGRMLNGAQPYEVFAAVIDEELERARK